MAVNLYPFAVKEHCELRIALYPLRYSAHAMPDGGAAYAYDLPSLEQGFPPLAHAQYGLRCIGGGFIYLFDETQGEVFVWRVDEDKGQFIELQARNHTLAGALKGYRPGAVVRHLWARACSVVHLLLTDTLLTARKIRDIQLDRDGIRARLATTIGMQAWTAESPARHTFAAEHIGKQVEEYKGTHLDFSPWPVRPVIPMAEALLTGMKAVAPAKQLAVVMHDHIALVQDLGGLINTARRTLERYTRACTKSRRAAIRQGENRRGSGVYGL